MQTTESVAEPRWRRYAVPAAIGRACSTEKRAQRSRRKVSGGRALAGAAGGVAFLLDEVMPASPAYRWTLNHTMRLDDPLELFPTFIVEAGV